MRSSFRNSVYIFTFIIFITPFFVGCNENKKEEEKENTIEQPTPVVIEKLERATMQNALLATSTVESRTSLDIVAEVPGIVTKLWVEQGDTTQKNQKLAKIQRAELGLGLKIANRSLKQLNKEALRLKPLFEKGIISRQIYDNAIYRAEQAKAEQRRARNAAGDARVKTPIEGVVALRHISLGQQVSIGTPLFKIVDPKSLIININLPERALSDNLLGRKVIIESDTLGISTTGSVEKISPIVDARSGTIAVRIVIDSPKETTQKKLIPGMFVRTNLIINEKKDVLIVPRRALIYNDKSVSVFTVNYKTSIPLAKRVSVKIGLLDSTRAEILEGLQENDAVIIIGQNTLKDGAKVEIEAPKSTTKTVPK